jgi:hypothetical protein
MRILMAPHAYLPSVGGVERLVEQLAASLKRTGHDVAILTDRIPGSPDRESMDGVEVWRVPFIPRSRYTALSFARNWPVTAAAIRRLAGEFRPDVVHQTSHRSTRAMRSMPLKKRVARLWLHRTAAQAVT